MCSAGSKKSTHLVLLLEDRREGRQLPRVVVGDVLKRLVKQERPQRLPQKERPQVLALATTLVEKRQRKPVHASKVP